MCRRVALGWGAVDIVHRPLRGRGTPGPKPREAAARAPGPPHHTCDPLPVWPSSSL